MPETYTLPKDYDQFVQAFLINKEICPLNLWILKPSAKSRGRGISLIDNYSGICCSESMVVQKYILNPLLVKGYKFDMRIYVLVTSVEPLEVFIYKEGFARLSTHKFTLDKNHINDLFVHLTNYSVQKTNIGQNSKNGQDPDGLGEDGTPQESPSAQKKD
jgi:tubulin polyglutamylase TTLL5